MGSARLWLPVLAVLLSASLVADAGPGPRAQPSMVRRPVAEQQPVQISAAIAANEFNATMVFANRLPDGVSPEPDDDCQDAYQWARSHGAQLVHGLRLRVRIKPSRYTQLVFLSASVRVTGTPNIRFRQEPLVFSCGDSRTLPYPGEEGADSQLIGTRQDSGLWFLPALGIPGSEDDLLGRPATWEDPYPFDVSATGTASFTIDITIADYLEPTQFVVDLRLRINDVEQMFELRDGDQPFTLLPWPGGMGFYPDQYHWCPGTPGRLDLQPGEVVTQESGYC